MTDIKQHPAVVETGSVRFGNHLPLSIIAGPCAMESRDHALEMAAALKEIAGKVGLGLVYKSSFDKANRTSLSGKRGIGLEKALEVFADLKKDFGFPVVTDIHTEEQCAMVAKTVDMLQIPAFLSRQTDLLVAAAKTGRVINVKKGQFLAPWDMKNVLAKLTESGNPNVMLCERGIRTFETHTRFTLPLASVPYVQAKTHLPVVIDPSHGTGHTHLVTAMARAAVAAGADGLIVEVHPNPDKAMSDGYQSMNFAQFAEMMRQCGRIAAAMDRELG
jgi:2-dehydro-3-deoxyphosphooctonate aldolase (KDO 8-P synthase)